VQDLLNKALFSIKKIICK